MRKVLVYDNGQRVFHDEGASMRLHGGTVVRVYDVSNASTDELDHIRMDLQNVILSGYPELDPKEENS